MFRENGSQITTRWEYKTFSKSTAELSVKELSGLLNERGVDGWELVSCVPLELHRLLFMMKRQLG